MPRLYDELEAWWPLLSPPSEYGDEAGASDGSVSVAHDRHVEGLFSRSEWLRWFAEAGIPAQGIVDSIGRQIFVGTREVTEARR